MESVDIARELIHLSSKCIKKKIEYTLIDCKKYSRDVNSFKNLLKIPFTIISYRCLPEKYRNKNFITKIPTDDYIEQKFILKENEHMVVGSLCELYNVKLDKQFEPFRNMENIYVPIREIRNCIKITKTIHEKYAKNNKIPTSWGAKHFCKVGDYLIVNNDGVYRIEKTIFKKTYEKI